MVMRITRMVAISIQVGVALVDGCRGKRRGCGQKSCQRKTGRQADEELAQFWSKCHFTVLF